VSLEITTQSQLFWRKLKGCVEEHRKLRTREELSRNKAKGGWIYGQRAQPSEKSIKEWLLVTWGYSTVKQAKS
jgi:hypothetical protein